MSFAAHRSSCCLLEALSPQIPASCEHMICQSIPPVTSTSLAMLGTFLAHVGATGVRLNPLCQCKVYSPHCFQCITGVCQLIKDLISPIAERVSAKAHSEPVSLLVVGPTQTGITSRAPADLVQQSLTCFCKHLVYNWQHWAACRWASASLAFGNIRLGHCSKLPDAQCDHISR